MRRRRSPRSATSKQNRGYRSFPVSRLEKPLNDWALDDVCALVSEKIEEGQRLEYKRELSLDSQGNRVEAAKDASGMANGLEGCSSSA